MGDNNLFQIEKQKILLDHVNQVKKATVNELCDLLDVSKVTIRKYLNELESKGLVFKTYGGVLSADSELNYEIPYSSKQELHSSEKQKIGKAGAALIREGDVVILDTGSTTYEVAHNLKNINVTVITNDVKIAFELASKSNINLIITGGVVQKNLYAITSFQTENFLSQIHANIVFLGADAVNLEDGITNRTMEESVIKQTMIKAAERVVLVVDHSKLHRKAFSNVCKIEKIDTVVIDSIDEEYKKAFHEKGLKIILAQ